MELENNNTTTPKVSILMPAYNAEKFIGVAIESVLNQTFTDFELIIIDDCSKDNTWNIILEYAKKDSRIKTFKNEVNLNTSLTLNKGIDLCSAKYIAKMDNDDYRYPESIEKQFNYMESHPDVGVCGGSIEICDENLNKKSLRKYDLTDESIRKNLFRYNPVAHPLAFFKKDAIKEYYNKKLSEAEDYDLYFRIGQKYKFGNLEDVLLKYRVNENSISVRKAKKQQILTLYIRIKAVIEYGYSMTFADKIYFLTQLVAVFTIPNKLKMAIFNLIRNSK